MTRTIKVNGTSFTMSDRSYDLVNEGAALALVNDFKAAWAAYRAAQDKADEAFARWFSKRQSGEPTNGAQASRLQNEASYLSADLAGAALKLYALDIDPTEIVPEYSEI